MSWYNIDIFVNFFFFFAVCHELILTFDMSTQHILNKLLCVNNISQLMSLDQRGANWGPMSSLIRPTEPHNQKEGGCQIDRLEKGSDPT